MHASGIIHRDIKLENILMSSENIDAVPTVGDFGHAVFYDEQNPIK